MPALNDIEIRELGWATREITVEILALLDPKTGRKFKTKKAKKLAVEEIVKRHVLDSIECLQDDRRRMMTRILRVKPN